MFAFLLKTSCQIKPSEVTSPYVLVTLDRFFRSLFAAIFTATSWLLIPVKLVACDTEKRWLCGLVLELTSFAD